MQSIIHKLQFFQNMEPKDTSNLERAEKRQIEKLEETFNQQAKKASKVYDENL